MGFWGFGAGSSASTLIVKRGGKINAIGTSEEPIIFTAKQDNLDGNLNEGVRGLWGGVIINGKAPASFVGNVTEFQIEGIPATDLSGRMGGTEPHDNSGIFRYVSIRHGGSEIGEGNEINGLTLGAVGDGTQVDHVEIVGNTDDGIEIFGGTVNPHHILVPWGEHEWTGDWGRESELWTEELRSKVDFAGGSHCDHKGTFFICYDDF